MLESEASLTSSSAWGRIVSRRIMGRTGAGEFGAELFAKIIPGSVVLRTSLSFMEALFNHFKMPIGYGNGLRPGSDAVPKRLKIVELLLDR